MTLWLVGCSGWDPPSPEDRRTAEHLKTTDPGAIYIPDLQVLVAKPPTACSEDYTLESVEGEDSSALVDCDTVTLRISRWVTPLEPAPLLAEALVKDGTVTWRDEGGYVVRIVAEGISDEELAVVAWSTVAYHWFIPTIQVPEGFTFPTVSTYGYSPTLPPKPVTTR